MQYSYFVGRVGALAVALGVGSAVAVPAGVAWAEPAETSDTAAAHGTETDGATTATDAAAPTEPRTTLDSTPHPSTGPAAVPTKPSGGTEGSATTVDVAPGVTVSSSGGAHTSTHGTKKAATQAKSTLRSKTGTAATTPRSTPTTGESFTGTANTEAAPSMSNPQPQRATATATATATAPVMTAAPATLFSSLLAGFERGLADSPVSWLVLAAARREIGDTSEAKALPLTATQTATTPVQNEPPTAQAVFTTPNPTTGAVKGQLVGTDPEGKKVTFAVTAKPASGTLVFNATTKTFTYTPTTAQRILAGLTPQADTVAMTVTASDGTTKVPVQIAIPISAIPITVRTDVPGVSGGGAIAATNTRAYVTDRDKGTVTVIDTVTATVIGTFAVGAAPDGLAVKPDGTRLYVASSANDTVTVIDTATGAVKATIAIDTPAAITVAPSGSSIIVTSPGTVTRISTATNKVVATVTLPAGSQPTSVAVSPDSTRYYITTTTAVLSFTSSSTKLTVIAEMSSTATGVAVAPNGATLYVGGADGTVTAIDVRSRTVLGTVQVGGAPVALAVSRDGSTVVVTDDAGRVATFDAATGTLLQVVATSSRHPVATLSPDGTESYVTDADAGVVHVVSLTPPNARPVAGTPTMGTPTATGAVTGTVGVTDPDGDPLTYSVSGAPSRGKLVLNANGTFTYTPTAAARHAASAGATTDSFTVTVSDGRRGVVTSTVTVTISPTNKAPTITKTVGAPNGVTGVVTGAVKGTDADRDTVTYTPTTAPTKGTVTVTATGAFTYTPTAAARHAAMKPGATAADTQDSFTISVDDGHGGVVAVAVTVKVSPANAKPTGGNGVVTQTDPRTGVVTGVLGAVDADGDALTYTASASKKGTLVVGANGVFTYTPTDAARDAASVANASAAATTDAITITVSDGYGGTATFTLAAPITPYPAGNRPPGNGQVTVGNSSSPFGTVTGTVTATDPEGDPLTYTITGKPTKGTVTIDPVTGAFSYTPTVDARYTALVTPGADTDTFAVTVSDGLGGTMVHTVSVTVAPPSDVAVDQRPTNVAINAPNLLFYTQAQINNALNALQSTGIDTIRILIPWAAVEAWQGRYDWSAVDRVVNSAAARGIKVLGVLNSTPLWAAVANTMPLAGAPANPAQFAKFVSLAAARYKGKVESYEVWNEPNGVISWQPTPNAAQYTTLLKAAYTAIKAADPNALVVAGAVGATIDFPGVSANPVRFISEMYAAGAAGYFDALSFHPYLYNNLFSKGTLFDSPLSQANRIYALMVANGDGDKKLWATEYGQPSSVVSEANEASYLGDFLRTWRNLSYAGPTFIHTLVDATGSDPIENSFGLFHTDWTPKQALAIVMQVIAENQAINAASYGL